MGADKKRRALIPRRPDVKDQIIISELLDKITVKDVWCKVKDCLKDVKGIRIDIRARFLRD